MRCRCEEHDPLRLRCSGAMWVPRGLEWTACTRSMVSRFEPIRQRTQLRTMLPMTTLA